MTSVQKEQLQRMRYAGKSYGEIGTALGMKESSVRTYCCRNGLTDKAIEAARLSPRVKPSNCKACGVRLTQAEKQKPKTFCSDKCRMAWWAKNRDAMGKKAVYTIQCAKCGKEFESYGNKTRKYCCHGCYIADRFGRNATDFSA